MWATGAAFGDYDGDGWADLFVAHYVDFRLDNMAAFGSSDYLQISGNRSAVRPSRLARDHPILSITTTVTEPLLMSRKNPAWRTKSIATDSRLCGRTSINDGKLDLLVANDGQPNYLYQGDGKGAFTDVAFTVRCRSERDWRASSKHGRGSGRLHAHGTHVDCLFHISTMNTQPSIATMEK